MRRLIQLLWLVPIVTILVAAVILAQGSTPTPARPLNSVLPTQVPPTATLSPRQVMQRNVQLTLTAAAAVTPYPKSYWQTRVAQILLTPDPTSATFPTSSPELQGTAAGDGYITNLMPPPWSPMAFLFQNEWQTYNPDRKVMTVVWAGAFGSMKPNAGQGVIVVATDTIVQGQIQSTNQIYTATSKSLRVVSAIGSRLTLTSTDGLTLTFDVATRQYVASLSTTVTPSNTK